MTISSGVLSASIISSMLIIHLSYFQIAVSQSICEDNNYPCRGDDDSWWYSTNDIIPTDGTVYGQLILRDSMYMKFDIINNEDIANQWENIFRIGFDGSTSGGCDGLGSRYPSLYKGADDDFFHFSVSDSANTPPSSSCFAGPGWQKDPPDGFGIYEMVKGRKYSVIINYNESRVIIQIKDNTLNTPWETYIDTPRTATDPLYFNTNVWIFMGDGSIPTADVTLSNVIIVSYWQNDSFTLPPTSAPIEEPTDMPTKKPSISPTISICEENNYPCQSDDDSWWNSTDDIMPVKGDIYGKLTLRDSMYVKFDIVSHESIANQWENIFRIGYPSVTDRTCSGQGSRYPALFTGPDDDIFHFAVSEISNCWAGGEWQRDFGNYEIIQGRNYSVIIDYDDSWLTVRLKDNTLNTPWDTYIDTPRTGTNPLYFNTIVNIFIGNDNNSQHRAVPVANVTLSNMVILSYWEEDDISPMDIF